MAALGGLAHKKNVQSSRTPNTRAEKTFSAVPFIGYLANELPMLYAYLGDVAFNKIADEYVSTNSRKRENANFLGTQLPQFLQASQSFAHNPEIFELASFEVAINKAFVAPETCFATSLEFEPSQQQSKRITFVESAQVLLFNQNTTSIWAALKCEEKPPRPHRLDEPQHVLVWRQRGASRFRILGEEEANLFQHFAKKAKQKPILEKSDVQRTSNYLRSWLDAELVACAV